ncbi:MAG TPA: hypothetical protein VGN35_05225 [Jatrophihabitantaceae bacterium]|jgi:hypothetical protein|nr:hypothetical protein [Jatrophihabitantaceae bacterium]
MSDPNAPMRGQEQPPEQAAQQPPAAYPPPPGYPPPPAYAPQPMGPVTTQFARLDPGPSQKFGALGFFFTLIGTASAVVAFTAVDWFDGNRSSSFHSVHNVIDAARAVGVGSPPVARAYFSWLGWALLAAAILTALLAATPTIGGPFRVVGIVVAAGAVVATFVGIKVFNDSALLGTAYRGYGSYLRHARAGFYLAVFGFVLIGVGAALGTSRDR